MTCRQALHPTLALADVLAQVAQTNLWLAQDDAVAASLSHCSSRCYVANSADSTADYDVTTGAENDTTADAIS